MYGVGAADCAHSSARGVPKQQTAAYRWERGALARGTRPAPSRISLDTMSDPALIPESSMRTEREKMLAGELSRLGVARSARPIA